MKTTKGRLMPPKMYDPSAFSVCCILHVVSVAQCFTVSDYLANDVS